MPTLNARRIAVKVTPSAEKAIRNNHPWLFTNAITSVSHGGQAGDIAIVFDRKRRFLAAGLYDPDSPIRVKLLQHLQQAQIDSAWFSKTITAALALRQPLTDSIDTTGYRCINGENDSLPGLIVDYYARVAVVKLYSTIWLPHLTDILNILLAQLPISQIVIRLSRRLQALETGLSDGQLIYGPPITAPIRFQENGLSFEANVIKGQKTGHFLDQRDNRAKVRDLSQGKMVLDLFAATGGFSLYAAAGGAKQVVSVDLSRPTLAVAERNFAHNSQLTAVNQCNHKLIAADVFDLLQQMVKQRRRFDLIVVDPPAFAQKEADVPQALRAYTKLAKLASQLVARGGQLVMASCSSRVSAEQFFSTVQRAVPSSTRTFAKTGHAIDHPISFKEGAYLKCIYFNF
ncbi:MAG: class I SAM-dependent rRNA methyltransferase [Candidatus Promineifilaceae bacterium]